MFILIAVDILKHRICSDEKGCTPATAVMSSMFEQPRINISKVQI